MQTNQLRSAALTKKRPVKFQIETLPTASMPPAPMNEALAENYGERPRQHLADGGYTKFDDIEALEKAGVEVYAPIPVAARQEPRALCIFLDSERFLSGHKHRNMHDLLGEPLFLVRGVYKVKSIALLEWILTRSATPWGALAHQGKIGFSLPPRRLPLHFEDAKAAPRKGKSSRLKALECCASRRNPPPGPRNPV